MSSTSGTGTVATSATGVARTLVSAAKSVKLALSTLASAGTIKDINLESVIVDTSKGVFTSVTLSPVTGVSGSAGATTVFSSVEPSGTVVSCSVPAVGAAAERAATAGVGVTVSVLGASTGASFTVGFSTIAGVVSLGVVSGADSLVESVVTSVSLTSVLFSTGTCLVAGVSAVLEPGATGLVGAEVAGAVCFELFCEVVPVLEGGVVLVRTVLTSGVPEVTSALAT